jgi:hypothetical protein
MNTIAEVLNAVSVAIGALIGAVGVVFDFKDKNGRVTMWGRWAISCIVLTGVIALTTQVIKVRADIAAEKAAAQKAEQVSELERRIHNPLGRFVASIELRIPKYRFGSVASAEELHEKVSKLVVRIAITRASIKDDGSAPMPTSLEFELIPFEDARPAFLLSRRNLPSTRVDELADYYEIELNNLVPVVDKLTPEMMGWSDLELARVYVGIDGLEIVEKENAKPNDIYRIERFEVRNERGMDELMGRRDFAVFDTKMRFVYGPGGEQVEFPIDFDFTGSFPELVP